MGLIKKFVFLIVFLCSFVHISFAVDLGDFVNDIKEYSNEYFPELNNDNFINELISGNISLNDMKLFERIFYSFVGEFRNNISLILKVVGIAILCSVLKNIQSSFGNTGVSEIAFYVCYILIVILIITSFTSIVDLCRTTILKLSDFMKLLLPLIIALIVATR